MSEDRPQADSSPTPTMARRLEALCDEFEQECKSSPRPLIEDYLLRVPQLQRAIFLADLLKIEVAYRFRAGEVPQVEDYLSRFADYRATIQEEFANITRLYDTTLAPDYTPHNLQSLGESGEEKLPTIAGYQVLAKLDCGGMGVVYKARQIHLNRLVAIKMVKAGELAGPQEIARFKAEAEAVARIDHPHIVKVYEFGEQAGLPYFSMEFLSGGTLSQRLQNNSLSADRAVDLVEILARAIHCAHERRIIHRDLKPANVLFTAEGIPKLCDFGLVKFLDSDRRISKSHMILGTPSYMSPEQARGQTKDIDAATDVYGLSAIFYHALTGCPPFHGASPELILAKVSVDDPVRPTHVQPQLSAALEDICLKCLEKDPAKRYASALELAEDLRRFRAGEPLAIESVSELERQKYWARRIGYEILDLIGCSSLGMIFMARQTRLKRLVALKIISAQAQADPDKVARFQAEAKTAALLEHPNIVHVYDMGEFNSQFFIAQEYVDGGTLLEKCVGMPQREAARLVEILARATHCAHHHGVLHTDLRPFNVQMTSSGSPKITGFGLAGLLEKGQEETPAKGALRVLSSYMAPEQAAGRIDQIGPATDVHALGAILYHLVTNEAPYAASTVLETLDLIQNRDPTPPSQLRQNISRKLDDICLKCLQKDPRLRYASAEELADDLKGFASHDMTNTYEFELVPGYELIEQLGGGGLGIVYQAEQISLQRKVALKIFRTRITTVLAISRALARLQHPNLVQVYDCGEREEMLYVAEELVAGSRLDRLIALGPKTPAEAVAMAKILAEAVHYMHGRGIVHRNLKPRSVLLTEQAVPKIGNFDFALVPDAKPDQEEVQGQTLRGTPGYMAPEQVRGPFHAIGPATDIYGLGAILYELLTGRPPFQADNPLDLLKATTNDPPAPPSAIQAGIPKQLDRICLKCLEKEPAKRYADAHRLAGELGDFLSGKSKHGPRPTLWNRFFPWFTA